MSDKPATPKAVVGNLGAKSEPKSTGPSTTKTGNGTVVRKF